MSTVQTNRADYSVYSTTKRADGYHFGKNFYVIISSCSEVFLLWLTPLLAHIFTLNGNGGWPICGLQLALGA